MNTLETAGEALESLQAEVKHLNLHLKATQSGRNRALARLAELEMPEPDFISAYDDGTEIHGFSLDQLIAYGASQRFQALEDAAREIEAAAPHLKKYALASSIRLLKGETP